MSALHTWGIKHRISPEAMRELQTMLGLYTPPLPPDAPGEGKSEAWAQSAIRLEASRRDVHLFRNNVGALKDATGRVVRFGLANDSAALNEVFKSPDLVGWRRVLIEPHHVGYYVGQTVLREIKEPGWQFTGDKHETAQKAFLDLALSCGCDAAFATGPGTL